MYNSKQIYPELPQTPYAIVKILTNPIVIGEDIDVEIMIHNYSGSYRAYAKDADGKSNMLIANTDINPRTWRVQPSINYESLYFVVTINGENISVTMTV